MRYISAEGKQGRVIIARLKPGQELVEGINLLLRDKKIKAGYIPVLLGGFKNLKINSMTLSKDEEDPENKVLEYREPLEYFGNGTIAQVDGKPSVHIHLAAAQSGNRSIGGHLISGEIVLLTEIVIVELLNVKITRRIDKDVSGKYQLLSFD